MPERVLRGVTRRTALRRCAARTLAWPDLPALRFGGAVAGFGRGAEALAEAWALAADRCGELAAFDAMLARILRAREAAQ